MIDHGFKIGDIIVCTENSGFGKVKGFSASEHSYGWPIICGDTAVNPRFYRQYTGAASVFEGLTDEL